ncbi:MAG TPA: UDP-N-acetylmuramoyl-L-alanyl-D-glutamate--2,6-diaminopimelate ligase [Sedimentisphaerales bacterium]|nr:UDP-N-acetylmuramoyl-L-alanyl-D-glutamate--2,6-diaminopimelate ligase [Phycisphaerae bacterium]HON91169.1 UDP-N-acetylmuramoyl-L-alanyl-D-glutamate--2,6-diaminopimelate ligase [Sedimentisphaerales bacterium]HQI27251.1 UDP-N-acetylmuramoyl-L-alanyl-D-glutamate--2,6-diaminopimelate ligase [Sedimentisphaerales bacterium]
MEWNQLLSLVASNPAVAVRIDSRQVQPGDVFVAIRGASCDGHQFIGQAIAKGARYIVCENGTPTDGQVTFVPVENPAVAAGLLAQASNGNPGNRLTCLAVTGTNGKTTVTYLVKACIESSGRKCGLIGTVVYDTGSGTTQSSLTTPDCLTLAEAQREMVAGDTTHMVMEASSHALSQDRLAGVNFRAAAFTNLTGDHMDYHKTVENYLAAKTRLFTALAPDAVAVLNKQAPQSKSIADATSAHICWYAIDESADLTAHIRSMTVAGTEFTLEHQGRTALVRTPLLGKHNVSNHLAAGGLCLAAGMDLEAVASGLSSLPGVPGRLEKVGDGDVAVLVDYAHTDDALQNVLTTLRPLCKGRLTVLFGCGGDRDRTKRPRMAQVAERLADTIVVTSDNPRTEDPDAIIGEILTGFADPGSERITVESDRRKAIKLAIENARPGDIVLLAGKGHETYQIIGKERFHFSDQDIARQCLKERQCSPS